MPLRLTVNKKRRGRKKRGREKKRGICKGENKKDEENVRMFLCWSLLVGKKKKKNYLAHRGKLTFVAEFSVRVHVVKMAEPLLVTYATPPVCEQKKKRKKKKRGREKKRGTEAQERKRREKNNVRVSAGCCLSKIKKI